MKKIINKAENVVPEMCYGISMASPKLALDADYKIIHRKKINPDKVNLISGGGSGHEPAHAGFVGIGMLDAAVCGDVFASPSQIQIYKAITRAKSTKGVLLIIKNYSGDEAQLLSWGKQRWNMVLVFTVSLVSNEKR